MDYNNEDTKFEENNYSYGFKEIDTEFINNSNEFINVDSINYFTNNLGYIKKKITIILFLIKMKNFQFNQIQFF